MKGLWRRITGRSAGDPAALGPSPAPPPRLAVVLGGGATLGAVEAGVIDALIEAGVRPDLLVGTSVGALNASFWAFSPTDDVGTRLRDVWRRVNRSVMMPEGIVRSLGRLTLGGAHVTTQAGLVQLIRTTFPDLPSIEDSRIRLVVTTTDIATGERVPIRSGPLETALLASTAIPGLYPPVRAFGRWLVDGGVVANCDLEAAIEAGMTDVIAVDVMSPGPLVKDPSVREMVERTVAMSLRRQSELAWETTRGRCRVAMLTTKLWIRPGFDDFGHTDTLFQIGQEAGRHLLSECWNRDGTVVHTRIDHEPLAPWAAGEDASGAAAGA